MKLSPREIDKLLLHNAGSVAQKRYARGLRLNHPEALSLIAAQMLEFIRDGDSVATLMEKGKKILGMEDVLPGVSELLAEVQVEGTFPDGTKLVTVHRPICREKGEEDLALYGSSLKHRRALRGADTISKIPGRMETKEGVLELNANRETMTLTVTNTGDRPIQVGSHYPFFETNPALSFDREKTPGFRLNIPAGTAVRFEPGEKKQVTLVAIGGNRIVRGGSALLNGGIDDPEVREGALRRAKEEGFESS